MKLKTEQEINLKEEDVKNIVFSYLSQRFKLNELGYIHPNGTKIEIIQDLHNKDLEIKKGPATELEKAADLILKNLY